MLWTERKHKRSYTDYGYTDDITSGFGYNGEVLDDTGLIYLRARYYNLSNKMRIEAMLIM